MVNVQIRSPHEKGQALLIIILVMVVGLAVGLAVASRSLTNLRNATEEENSQRAFSNAEAGVERLLRDKSGDATGVNNAYFAQVSSVGGTEFLLGGGNTVRRDDGGTIWLTPHKADGTLDYATLWNGTLTLYWGTSSDCASGSNGAVEMILISGSKINPVSSRYVYDPCASRRSGNNFTASDPGGAVAGKSLVNSNSGSVITITNGIVARVIPLYADAIVGVRGSSAFPSQGSKIESTGNYQNTTRKITVYQGYPELFTELFQYNLLVPKLLVPK